ncbi:hypothetical protein D9757_004936 [Collybiopsis confluens]|uniref:Uncharacterized protein n=1 Tax=Collybiopsis confluens TaxID=2823264 RepID=A0A8H5MCM7_9AGAR|nr:hypothetical protein D9757_004936 [Collybiopsis confluens]
MRAMLLAVSFPPLSVTQSRPIHDERIRWLVQAVPAAETPHTSRAVLGFYSQGKRVSIEGHIWLYLRGIRISRVEVYEGGAEDNENFAEVGFSGQSYVELREGWVDVSC